MRSPSNRCASDSPRRCWLMAIVLVLANLAAWSGSIDAPFVFDDHVRIVEEERRLASPFPLSYSLRFEQRPLTWLTLAANYAAGDLDPRGYRVVNLLLHLAAALALFAAVREGVSRWRGERDWRSDWVGFAAALLWSLHPLQAAALGQVVQRAEILASLFTILAAWSMLRSMREGASIAWRILVPLAVAMAILSKPTGAVAPVLLLVVDRCLSRESWRRIASHRGVMHAANFACLLILPAVGAIAPLLASDDGPKGAGLGVVGIAPLEYATLQVRAIGLYVELAAWPATLSIDHGREALLGTPLPVIGVSAILLAAGTAFIGLLKARWWGVPGAIFLIALAPTSSVVPLADVVAEHRMHLALSAIAIVLALGGVAIVGRASRRSPQAGAVAAVTGVALLTGLATAEGVRTHRRMLDYREPARLWSEVLDRRPDDLRALLNRSHASILAGDPEAASIDLARLEAIAPTDPMVLVNRAILELEAGDAASALAKLDRAVAAMPKSAAAHLSRGDALRMLGRPREAAFAYAAAEELRPSDPLVPLARGNALSELELHEEALACFLRAAEVADRTGQPELAASAFFNAGNMHFTLERYREAVASYRAALERNRDHADAGIWLDESRRMLEQAEPGVAP
ncbi:MAG: tetratricopeptide repeat protein [Phycisphaerales bacterium]